MKLTQAQKLVITDLKASGLGSRSIAEIAGCSKSTVNNFLASLKVKPDYDPKDVAFKHKKKPRIVLLDIETAPDIAVTFKRFKANIGLDNVLREGGWLLSAAWKTLGDSKVKSVVLTPEEAKDADDSRIIAELYDLLEDTDILIGHNLERFDLPIVRARSVVHFFPEHKKVKVIDTLKIAKQMRFQSNRLDALGKTLAEGRKLEHEGIQLWVDCMAGKKDALKRMQEYNEQDVNLLENVYNRIKHMDSKTQNLGLYYDDGESHCPACGSTDLEYTGNSVYTQVSEFKEVICNDCGHRSRDRTTINTKEQRKALLM